MRSSLSFVLAALLPACALAQELERPPRAPALGELT